MPQGWTVVSEPTTAAPPPVDRSQWDKRADGSTKGDGFLGVLQRPDGKVSSEISIGVNIDGKEVEVPTLVPTLTPQERQWLLTNDVSDPSKLPKSIIQKATDFARPRIAAGKSPFAQQGESPTAAPGWTPVQETPHFTTSNEKDAAGNAVVDPNTAGTFARHVGEQINPVPIGQMIPFPKAAGGAGWDAPVQAVKNVGAAQGEVFDRMKESYAKGDIGGAAIHAVNFLIPILGPIFDKAGNEIRAGHIAAGVGDSVGLGLAMVGPKGASNVIDAAKGTVTAARMATAAEKGATARAVEVMAPQVGPNKVKLGNMAASVAPDVLRETTAHTRGGLLDQAVTKLDEASTKLDAAYDAVPNTKMFPTAPVIAGIQKAINDLSISGIGGKVEPATRAARIASLRQALTEVRQLGAVMNLDNLRKLRQAWDEGAKAVFTPSVAQDFLKARGAGSGYADARSVLGDYMTTQHPELADLNAQASLWIKAGDVMQAAEEADRVRPRVGRSIMARGLGAAVGGSTEGPWGAAVGAVVGPTIERAVASTTPAVKLFVARRLLALSDALRTGSVGQVQSILSTLERSVPKATAIQAGRATVGQALPKAADKNAQP